MTATSPVVPPSPATVRMKRAKRPSTLAVNRKAKAAILLAAGAKTAEIAEQLSVTGRQARNIIAEVQPAVLEHQARTIAANCEELVRKAFPAIAAGLDDSTDSYKRAGVGISVLKGRGVFSPDASGASYQTIVMATPDGLRDTLLSDATPQAGEQAAAGIARFPAESEKQ